MNLKNILVFSLAFTLTLGLNSCKKDEDEPQSSSSTPLTNSQKLVGNDWMEVAFTADPAIDWDGNGTLETDLFVFSVACDIDDIIDFNSDGTYIVDEGASKCDVNDPQVIETGTWIFNVDETVVVLTDSDGYIHELEIESLSSAQLVITESYQLSGVDYILTYN